MKPSEIIILVPNYTITGLELEFHGVIATKLNIKKKYVGTIHVKWR